MWINWRQAPLNKDTNYEFQLQNSESFFSIFVYVFLLVTIFELISYLTLFMFFFCISKENSQVSYQ